MSARSFLFGMLLRRDLRERFSGSWLGFSWGILQPGAQAAAYVLVFGGFLGLRPQSAQGVSPAAWLIAGMLPWLALAEVLSRSPQQLVMHARLLTRHAFDWRLIPLAPAASALVNHGVLLLLWIVCLPWTAPGAQLDLFALFAWCLCLAVMAGGLALLAAAVGAWFRDLAHAAPLMAQLWGLVTPIAYSAPAVPARLTWALVWNPLYHIVGGYRAALVGLPQDWTAWAAVTAFGAMLCAAGLWVFHRWGGDLPDVL